MNITSKDNCESNDRIGENMAENMDEKAMQIGQAAEPCAGGDVEGATLLAEPPKVESEQLSMEPIKEKQQEVVVSIDYEKLAEAIIRAQEKVNEKNETAEPPLNVEQIPPKKHWWDIFPAIFSILSGKGSKNGAFTAAPFAWIVSFIYRAIAVLGTVGIVALDVEFVKIIKINVVQGLSVIGVIIFVIVVAFISFTAFCCMVIFLGASDDIKKEQDKNYIMSVFSGMMSVAALIVAIAALVKVK